MGHDVFVSHSSHDKAAADAVCAALEANGIRCWIAPRDIMSGERWATSILRGLSQCRLMVLVFSGHTNGSNHIRNEVERAVHHGIPIAPIRIEDALPAGDLELFLSSSHWMDALTPPLEKHLQQLAAQTRALLEMQGQTLPPAPKLAPPAAAAPTPRRRKLVPALLGAALLIGLAAWIWRGELARLWSNVTTVTAPNSPKPPASVVENNAPVLTAPATPATLPVQVVPPPPVVVPPPETPEAKARHQQEQQLQALKDLFLAERLTADQYQLGQVLFKSKPGELDEYDATRRAQFATVLEGRLTPDKLAASLAAIETPEQKTVRLAREEADRKEALRRDRVGRLLAAAKVDDSPDKGAEGLALLDDLLKLDPDNPDAISLQTRIRSMLAEAQRQHLAQLRQQKIAQLLAIAKANDSREKGHDALPALDDLLKLDPANAEASALRDKISAYYGPRKTTNSIGMTFIEIKPGEFLMGSPANEVGRFDNETQHKVKITRPFMMQTTHVTRGQFDAFIKDSGYQTEAEKEGSAFAFDGTKFADVKGASWKNPGFEQTDDHPVVEVSWNDAQAFCQWLSKKEGKTYRLPTEAQFEYASRAGSQGAYFWGDNPDGGDGFANCADLTAKEKFPAWTTFNWRDGFIFTSPVGSFKPNAFGLYDMIGNAFEWCNDYYGPYPAGDAIDPSGPAQGDANSSRVLRGGSWHDDPRSCRAAYRNWLSPGLRSHGILGFRCLLDVP